MTRVVGVPHRVVLSRKGFDSSWGGCASPILDGEMISLPIPEHNSGFRATQGLGVCSEKHQTYHGLATSQGKKIVELVNQLAKGKIKRSDCVHLDPDIRRELREPRYADLPLTYGQDSGPQTELRDLQEGDLFLFFGWFRTIREISPGIFRWAKEGPDIHAIWGWLQIAERLDLPNKLSRAQELAGHHPHVSHHLGRTPNCLYVGRETLAFLPNYPGAGTFSEFHDELRLSAMQTNLRLRRRLRSNWKLPAFFKDIHLTHHNLSTWLPADKSILGKGGAYPGQEFIFETKGYENEVAEWLGGLFIGGRRQYP